MRLLQALLATCALLLAFDAGAETYRWTDDRGQQHFTSNLQDVPPQKAAGYEPEKALIRGEQPPASASSPRSGGANPFRAVESRINGMGESQRVETERLPSKQERELTASEKFEVKCSASGERCRRVQTPEFRDWKAQEKAREGQRPD